PVNLASQDKITSAIAGEVVAGPFQSAQQEIARQELGHMVEARLGDGLAVIEPADQIDTITICGMGGALIVDILSQGLIEGKFASNSRLILQTCASVIWTYGKIATRRQFSGYRTSRPN